MACTVRTPQKYSTIIFPPQYSCLTFAGPFARTLNFTLKALMRNVQNESEELSASFKNAYSDSLANIHNFVMRGVASAAWGLVPYRADFYKKLGEDQAQVKADLISYLTALEKFVELLRAFIETESAIIPKKFKNF